jgi:AraC family transcriptional regulator
MNDVTMGLGDLSLAQENGSAPTTLASGRAPGESGVSVVNGFLASSAGRGWSGLAAELRSHSGVVAFKKPSPHIVICVDVQGGASVVTRQRDGIKDRTVSERGTIWLSPARGPGRCD